MRALVIVLDGIDEAAGRRDSISSFVRDVLVLSGLRVVCTSRPESVRVQEFASRFVILDLKVALWLCGLDLTSARVLSPIHAYVAHASIADPRLCPACAAAAER